MSTVYDEHYARRYRQHDDQLDAVDAYNELVAWLQRVSRQLPSGFRALDLGCGTGRYFWAIEGAGEIVGVDASAAMLAQAASPVHADRIRASITLRQGALATIDFEPASFDLVFAVGVLAEHAPLDARIVSLVHTWLRSNGRFAFTTVDPDSPSVPRTLLRRLARGAAGVAPQAVAGILRDRLLSGGLYADERRVRELLDGRFAVDSLDQFESEAHLHCRVVARKLL